MANWDKIKSSIAAVIKQNGNQEITGEILKQTLQSMVSVLGEYATFGGFATPASNPGTPDGPVFYFASVPGVYSNFGNKQVDANVNVLFWDNGSWDVINTGFASISDLNNFMNNVNQKLNEMQNDLEKASDYFFYHDDEHTPIITKTNNFTLSVTIPAGTYKLIPRNGGNAIDIVVSSALSTTLNNGRVLYASVTEKAIKATSSASVIPALADSNNVILLANIGSIPYGQLANLYYQNDYIFSYASAAIPKIDLTSGVFTVKLSAGEYKIINKCDNSVKTFTLSSQQLYTVNNGQTLYFNADANNIVIKTSTIGDKMAETKSIVLLHNNNGAATGQFNDIIISDLSYELLQQIGNIANNTADIEELKKVNEDTYNKFARKPVFFLNTDVDRYFKEFYIELPDDATYFLRTLRVQSINDDGTPIIQLNLGKEGSSEIEYGAISTKENPYVIDKTNLGIYVHAVFQNVEDFDRSEKSFIFANTNKEIGTINKVTAFNKELSPSYTKEDIVSSIENILGNSNRSVLSQNFLSSIIGNINGSYSLALNFTNGKYIKINGKYEESENHKHTQEINANAGDSFLVDTSVHSSFAGIVILKRGVTVSGEAQDTVVRFINCNNDTNKYTIFSCPENCYFVVNSDKNYDAKVYKLFSQGIFSTLAKEINDARKSIYRYCLLNSSPKLYDGDDGNFVFELESATITYGIGIFPNTASGVNIKVNIAGNSSYLIFDIINKTIRQVTSPELPILKETEQPLAYVSKTLKRVLDGNFLTYTVNGETIYLKSISESTIDKKVNDSINNVVILNGTPKFFNPPVNFHKEELRILDIGNSYTGNSTRYLADLINSAGIDVSKICHYKLIMAGASFKDWYQCFYNKTNIAYTPTKTFGGLTADIAGGNDVYQGECFRNVLKNNKWDIIIIHTFSGYSTAYDKWGTQDISYGYLNEYIRLLRTLQPQASIGFLSVHSYMSSYSGNSEKSSLLRWQNIMEATKKLRVNYNIDFVIPYGTAIQNLRASSLNNQYDLCSDGTHLGEGLAQYCASCAYYEALIAPIFGISVLGNKFVTEAYKTSTYVESDIDVTKDNAPIAQKSAILAVNDWYSITNPENVDLTLNI